MYSFLDRRGSDALRVIERISPSLTIVGTHLVQSTRNLLKFDKGILLSYHELSRVVVEAVDTINDLDLDGMNTNCNDCRVDIVGMFCVPFSHRQAVYQLALVGHTLEALVVLRSQIESMLNFLYIIDGEKTHKGLEERIKKYKDWVRVRMKGNLERSLECNQVFKQMLYTQEYIQTVSANFEEVKSRLETPVMKQLQNKYNFLGGQERAELALKFRFKELYDHVYAESSASVHGADFGDRVRISEDADGKHVEYRLNSQDPGLYPVLLSNVLLFRVAETLVQFFGVEDQLLPSLKTALKRGTSSAK